MYIVRDPFPYQHGLQRVAESNVANNTAVEHITQLWLADLARGLQGFHSSTLSFFKFWLSHIQSRADKQFLYELNCFLLLLISVFYQHSGGKHLLSPLRCLFGCVIRSLTVSIKLDINSKKLNTSIVYLSSIPHLVMKIDCFSSRKVHVDRPTKTIKF